MNLPPNFWVGLALWVAATGLVVRMLWIFPGIERRPRSLKAIFSTLAVSAFVFFAWKPVTTAYEEAHQKPNPSLPFIFGAPLGDNDSPVWMMMLQHYGSNPAYNCDLDFYDQDRKNIEHNWLTEHPNAPFPPQGLAGGESQKHFHIPEVDPVGRTPNFQWRPLNSSDQHYTVEIICRGRDGQFHEDWEVSRISGVLRTSIKIERPSPALSRNPTFPANIFECTDPEFESFPVMSTMPSTFDPSAAFNPGWKPNHRIEAPVVIIDENGNIEAASGPEGVKSLGCWNILMRHLGD